MNPIAVIPFFQGLTASATGGQRNMILNRACLVVIVVLVFFASVGDLVLSALGITLHYIMIAGGLYVIVFAVKSALGGGVSEETPRNRNSANKSTGLAKDVAERIAIVPIGTPLLAGPGSIATAMILNDDPSGVTTTIIAIIVNALLAWVILKLSSRLARIVSPSILMILSTVMNILIAAIGVAFVVKGVSAAFSIKFI